MGAQESASHLNAAAGDLHEASQDLAFIGTDRDALQIETVQGTIDDVETLINSCRGVITSLSDGGVSAHTDLASARRRFDDALTSARAADGADGIGALCQGIDAADDDAEALQARVAEAAATASELAALLDQAKAKAQDLLAQLKAIQDEALEIDATADGLSADADEIADQLNAAVA